MTQKQKAQIEYVGIDDATVVKHYPGSYITNVNISRHDTDEKKSYRGEITFETEGGETISTHITHKHTLKNMLQRAKTWWPELDEAIDKEESDDIFKNQQMDLRVASRGDTNWLLPPMSSRWAPVTVDDVIEPLAELLGPDQVIRVTPSNGIHGGMLQAYFKGNDIAKYSVTVSGGNLLGTRSLYMYAGAHILACSNQLTALVRQKVEPFVGGIRLSERRIHTTAQADLGQMLESVKAIGKTFIGTFEKAKTIKLDAKMTKRIVDYYESTGDISPRVRNKILMPALDDDDITQVPGTLYGFAMAASYIGTHNEEIKGGVKYNLNRVAGEVMLVANQFDAYYDAIELAPVEA